MARDRKALDEIRDARLEVEQWGPAYQSLLKEFDDAFGAAQAAAPAPAPQPAKPAAPVEEMPIALSGLADGWPENVRKEIVGLNLVDAKVALPVPALEQALKLGRIAFSW